MVIILVSTVIAVGIEMYKMFENRSVTFGTTEVRNVRGGIFSSAYIKERNTNIELPIDE